MWKWPFCQRAPGVAGVAGAGDAEPVALQEACQEVADLAVVVDHEYVWRSIRRRAGSGSGRRGGKVHGRTLQERRAGRQVTLHSVAFGPTGAVNPVGLARTPVGFPCAPPDARRRLDRIGELDPDLGRIEARAGPLPWRVRPAGFPGLLHALVGQRISTQAAQAIWLRLHAAGGASDPAGLLALDDAALRAAGFSRAKVVHARALAAAFRDGVLAAAALEGMDDARAVEAIAAVPGFGPWSAEVYLLFAHARPDVFPAGDLALAAGVAHLKALPVRPSPADLRGIADAWRPHRGLAARLLFHHWRHVTGRPAFDHVARTP